ncbi:lysozyme [Gluconacetobacter diazotrophicus PA1 5]|nr:lysozyme [Gluconacetobacter diazotrophicus PA1 5]
MAQMAPEVVSLQNEITTACMPQILTDSQLTALTSFAYNVGFDAFRGSTLHRFILAGNMTGAAGQFVLWDKADGEVVQGLLDRRIKERDIFLS